MVLWFNLATIVAVGQAAEVERPGNGRYPEVTHASYSATRPSLQADEEQTILLASATQKRSPLKIWVLLSVIGVLSTSLLALSIVYRTTKHQALQLKLLNQQLHRREQLLRHHNIKLEQFNRIAAHDILSNLNLIISAGNIWVGAQPKKENLLRYHAMTSQAARRLKDYCVSLLEETRRKNAADTQSPTDPMPILNGVLESFGPTLQEAELDIQTTRLSPVFLPAPIQEQVFRNIITNALSHAASARQPLLRIAEEKDDSGNLYWVLEDNGPGIPAQRREAIFNTHTSPREGSGQQMGLSLLRATLREYGADFRVEERKGGGARFVVVAPGRYQPQNITSIPTTL